MTYVITETCIDEKDQSCVEVCPVDCIEAGPNDRMLFINPAECIDCGACVDVCPVDAIYAEEDVPKEMEQYTGVNALHFTDAGAAANEVDRLKPPGDSGRGPAEEKAS